MSNEQNEAWFVPHCSMMQLPHGWSPESVHQTVLGGELEQKSGFKRFLTNDDWTNDSDPSGNALLHALELEMITRMHFDNIIPRLRLLLTERALKASFRRSENLLNDQFYR